MSLAILSISILLQFSAAGLALRLILITGRKRAWALIAVAMVLMGVRRCITFYRVYSGDLSLPPDLSAEWVALTISLLMFAGVAWIAPLFHDIRKTHISLRESRQQLQDFASAASDWFWEMDENLRFTYISEQRQELMGLSPAKPIGKTRWEIVGADPDMDPKWRDHRATLEAHKPFRDFQCDYVDINGDHHFTAVNGLPIFDQDGAFTGYRGTATDITERKLAEEALEESRRALQNVIDAVPAMVNCKDLQSRYTLMNRYQADLYRILPEDAVGMTASEIVGAKYGEYTEALDAEVLATKTANENFEEIWVDLTGYPRNLLTTKVPLLDKTGAVSHVVTVSIDITDRMQAEEDRRIALVDAEQANQAKSEFLATMSHELRTPLNAILGFSDILSNQYFGPPGEGKYREYASDIHHSGEHLLELVNDLLDISTIEAGKQSLKKERLSAGEMIAECFHALGQKAQDKGIKLITSISEHLPPFYADRRATRQIFLNLLSNAVKFTPEGGRITVKANASKQNTTFEIADTGKGIPAEKLPDLTEPFNRGARDPHLTVDGWGLGLAISKSLVDLHDGELDITSKVGKGTTVTVAMPNGAP